MKLPNSSRALVCLIAVAALSSGCGSGGTSLFVTVGTAELEVNQLRLSAQVEGTPILPQPRLLPETARRLQSMESVRLLLSEDLGGRSIEVLVEALKDGELVASGRGRATVVSGQEVRLEVSLEVTFGRAEFNNWYGLTADRKRVSRFIAPRSCDLTAISVQLDGQGTGGNQDVRLVAYADSEGAPGRLLAQTEVHTILAGAPGKEVRLSLPLPVALLAGAAYHLGVHSGAENGAGRYGHVLGIQAGMQQNDDSFVDGAVDPFGASVQVVDLGLSAQGHCTSSR